MHSVVASAVQRGVAVEGAGASEHPGRGPPGPPGPAWRRGRGCGAARSLAWALRGSGCWVLDRQRGFTTNDLQLYNAPVGVGNARRLHARSGHPGACDRLARLHAAPLPPPGLRPTLPPFADPRPCGPGGPSVRDPLPAAADGAGLRGDEGTYVAMAASLARDFDLGFAAPDRTWAESHPGGPVALILERTGKGLAYSKPVLYPLLAAPFVRPLRRLGRGARSTSSAASGAGAGAGLSRAPGRARAEASARDTLLTFVATGIVVPYVAWRMTETLQVALALAGLVWRCPGVPPARRGRLPPGDGPGGAPPRAAVGGSPRRRAPRPPDLAARTERVGRRSAGPRGAPGARPAPRRAGRRGDRGRLRRRARTDLGAYRRGQSLQGAARHLQRRDRLSGRCPERRRPRPLRSARRARDLLARPRAALRRRPHRLRHAVLLRRPAHRPGDLPAGRALFRRARSPPPVADRRRGARRFHGPRPLLPRLDAGELLRRRDFSRQPLHPGGLPLPAGGTRPSAVAPPAAGDLGGGGGRGASALASQLRFGALDPTSQAHANAGLFRLLPYESTASNLDGRRDRYWAGDFVRFVDPFAAAGDWSFTIQSDRPGAELEIATRFPDAPMHWIVVADAEPVSLVISDWRGKRRYPLASFAPGMSGGSVVHQPRRSLAPAPLLVVAGRALLGAPGAPVGRGSRYGERLRARALPRQACAAAAGFAREVEPVALPAEVVAGSRTSFTLEVRNTGVWTWSSAAHPAGSDRRADRAARGRTGDASEPRFAYPGRSRRGRASPPRWRSSGRRSPAATG